VGKSWRPAHSPGGRKGLGRVHGKGRGGGIQCVEYTLCGDLTVERGDGWICVRIYRYNGSLS